MLVYISRFSFPRHPLVASHYMTKFFLRLDKMHIFDLKGIIAIAAGSLLLNLVQNCNALGRTQQARMNNLNAQMAAFQEKQPHKMPPLRIIDLSKDGGWATLSGKLIKAANTRALVPWLKHTADKYHAGHGGHHSSVRKVFYSLAAIEDIIYKSPMFLSDVQKEELQSQLDKMGRHWMHLRHLSDVAGCDFWQITPKVHIGICAVGEQARLINPRFVQNYGEESLIGRMTKIWSASANGPYVKSSQRLVMTRYLVGLILRISSEFD